MSVPLKDETLTIEPAPSYVVTPGEATELVCDTKLDALAPIELVNEPSLVEVSCSTASVLALRLDLVVV